MPPTIYWMLVDATQTLPEAPGVLSTSELERFLAFRFPKRQNEWLLGRWTAKSLAHSLPAYQQYPLGRIEIQNTPEGAPFIQVQDGAAQTDCLSISHCGHLALCALAPGRDLRVGADLEKIEPRTETFILDYFTPGERQIVADCPAQNRAVVVTLIWSAKEAVLKALGVGLRWDTRAVEVCAIDGILPTNTEMGGWQKYLVRAVQADNPVWAAWWQRRDEFILTLAGFSATQAETQSIHLIEKFPQAQTPGE
jgi:4'-phosphopantetheinyl transferase